MCGCPQGRGTPCPLVPGPFPGRVPLGLWSLVPCFFWGGRGTPVRLAGGVGIPDRPVAGGRGYH